ncbi:PEP-CTERM sorting domain-containing protein [bacterium]|nr:PEP-CTERM sorting domain-containing protein [bacterium]
MKTLRIILAVVMIMTLCYVAQAYTLTFDDVPRGVEPEVYYSDTYGIGIEFPNVLISYHVGSDWGPPHSENNVLVASNSFQGSKITFMFKRPDSGHTSYQPYSVYSVGAYFCTQQDVVLQMVGYDGDLEHPVASAYIGATGESWKNRYVEISSSGDIGMFVLYSISTDAFHKFCMDDLNVDPVPEPSGFFALLGSLACMGGIAWRRRRA